jgi:hypothetical protein
MIRMSQLQAIRERIHPRFRPFTIRTVDGRCLDVPEYNSIAIGRRRVSVIDQADRVHDLRAQQIVSVSDFSSGS